MSSPLPRGIIAALITAFLAVVGQASMEPFGPLPVFVIVMAAVAFVVAVFVRPLYAAIAALVLIVVGPLLSHDIGMCLCALGWAVIVGGAVHMVANIHNQRRPAF